MMAGQCAGGEEPAETCFYEGTGTRAKYEGTGTRAKRLPQPYPPILSCLANWWPSGELTRASRLVDLCKFRVAGAALETFVCTRGADSMTHGWGGSSQRQTPPRPSTPTIAQISDFTFMVGGSWRCPNVSQPDTTGTFRVLKCSLGSVDP
jgi:hypothetical protein